MISASPSAASRWQGRRELRADLRAAVLLVVALAGAGVPAGLLWWLLAPRAEYLVTAEGPVPVGLPAQELQVADDSVLALVLLGTGLLCGALAWGLRRRRGVAVVLALAVGGAALAGVAWQLGELLGSGPTEAQLADAGTRVTTALQLGSLPVLAMAPFGALAAYLAAVLWTPDDDLGRPPAGASSTDPAEADRADRAEERQERWLAGYPPGQPTA